MDEAVAKIQATISGYSGRPCSLLSIYDKEHRIIVISKIAPYRDKPVDGASVITNVPNIQRDAFFAESDMKEAIQHFKTLHGMVSEDGEPGLIFDDGVGRADPTSSIESDGIDTSGEKFRIASSVSNEQVAVLATCLFVKKMDQTDNDIALIEGVNEAYDKIIRGWIVTV
jgi:hypothetical protein